MAKKIIGSPEKKLPPRTNPKRKKRTAAPRKSRSQVKDEWRPKQPLHKDEHEAFVQALFGQGARLNITDAYQQAYPTASRTAASAAGCRLLGNARIQKRLEWLKEQAANDKIATIVERKERLTTYIRASLADFQTELPDIGAVISYGKDMPNHHVVKKLKQQVRYEEGKDQDTNVTVRDTSIELQDPIRAIQELNRMEGAYPAEREALTALQQIAANGVQFVNNIHDDDDE